MFFCRTIGYTANSFRTTSTSSLAPIAQYLATSLVAPRQPLTFLRQHIRWPFAPQTSHTPCYPRTPSHYPSHIILAPSPALSHMVLLALAHMVLLALAHSRNTPHTRTRWHALHTLNQPFLAFSFAGLRSPSASLRLLSHTHSHNLSQPRTSPSHASYIAFAKLARPSPSLSHTLAQHASPSHRPRQSFAHFASSLAHSFARSLAHLHQASRTLSPAPRSFPLTSVPSLSRILCTSPSHTPHPYFQPPSSILSHNTPRTPRTRPTPLAHAWPSSQHP